MKEQEKLFIYIRVSTDEQLNKDLSLPRQKELGVNKAKELDMEPVILAEAGESASGEDFSNRPKMLELIALVNEGLAKNIFVFDQTRLSRNKITKALITEKFRKAGAQLYTASKSYDFDKHEDILTFDIIQAIEGYESALRKSRFKIGYVTANKKGRYLNPMPPYGYKKDEKGYLVVDEEEKAVFLKIVDLYINQGFGTNQIANWLNEQQIPTKTSKILKNGYTLKKGISNRKESVHKQVNKWLTPGTIMTLLKSEMYTGKRRFKTGKDSYEYTECEPLIDKETFDKIQIIRTTNAITKKKHDKYFYLLKGVLQCGNCGNPMHGRVKPDRDEYTYKCNSKREIKSKCDSRGINKLKLEKEVWDAFVLSPFYEKQIKLKMHQELHSENKLGNRRRKLEEEFTKLEDEEKVLNEKHENLLRKAIDPRFKGVVIDKILEEILKEAKIVKTNKSVCAINLKRLNQQIIDSNEGKTREAEIFSAFRAAYNELSSIQFPFNSDAQKNKARILLGEAIRNITVTYLPEKMEHKIEISFNPIDDTSDGSGNNENNGIDKVVVLPESLRLPKPKMPPVKSFPEALKKIQELNKLPALTYKTESLIV